VVIPVILLEMKTAISLPDDLFEAVDARARALKISRSSLFAQAAREFIAKHEPASDATAAWNRALAHTATPEDDRATTAFRARSKQVIRESWRNRG